MKVAICMWGASRWPERGSTAFKTLILQPLLQHNHSVRVYKHGPVSARNNAFDEGLSSDAHKMFDADVLVTEDQDAEIGMESMDVSLYVKHGNPFEYLHDGVKPTIRLLCALWSQKRVYEIMVAENWNPEVIIGYRPDTVPCVAFDDAVFCKLAPNTILLPDFAKYPINDRFFVCADLAVVKRYLCRGDHAKAYAESSKLHSETFLHNCLQHVRITEIKYPVQRIRADHTVFHLDTNLCSQCQTP